MQKIQFSKNDTLIFKGIAIIMMMFHHCFWNQELFKGYKISTFPLNIELSYIVNMSAFFKICVSIFAFLTGYGLYIALKKLNSKFEWNNKEIFQWIVNRLIKTLSGFWIVAILASIICQIIDGETARVFFNGGIIYGIFKIVINFFGLSCFWGTESFNTSWWYMSAIVVYIILIPIFAKLLKKYGCCKVLIGAVLIPRIIGMPISEKYNQFIFIILLGMIFAEKNLMVRIANFTFFKNKSMLINKIFKFIIESIVAIILYNLYLSLKVSLFVEIKYGVIPVFFMCYIYEFFVDIPILKNVLKFLGKHSMNIFLVHEFVRTNYMTDFLYSLRNVFEIGFVLLTISLAISIIIEMLKKIIKYKELINKLQLLVNCLIEKQSNKEFDNKNEKMNLLTN